jgi:hypothetical protein
VSVRPPDDRFLPRLGEPEVRALSEALRRWADRHPDAHRPLISFGGDRFVSASELAHAVQSGAGRGEKPSSRQDEVRQQYLRMVELVLLETPFEQYLGSIDRSGSPRIRLFRWPLELRDRLRRREREHEDNDERLPPPSLPSV